MNNAPPYEKSDVSIKGIVWFTVVLAVATAFTMWMMVVLYDRFEARAQRADDKRIPATRVPGAVPERPPAPILQGSPGSNFELQSPLREMEVWDEKMDEQLASSGWVDRNERVVRIPVEQAKELLLQRGLPVRPEGQGGGR